MKILNDMTNTFGFFGQGGVGPGKHLLNEFVSSVDFSKVANILNKISWLSAYSEESTEMHICTFYGSVLFRNVDSTMTALLDQTWANYGIALEYDNQDATTPNTVFNNSTHTFDIPIQDDLIIEDDPPFFRVEAVFSDPVLYKYRAAYVGFDPPNIKIALFDCDNAVEFRSLNFNLLGDYDLKFFIFGHKSVNVAVL